MYEFGVALLIAEVRRLDRIDRKPSSGRADRTRLRAAAARCDRFAEFIEKMAPGEIGKAHRARAEAREFDASDGWSVFTNPDLPSLKVVAAEVRQVAASARAAADAVPHALSKLALGVAAAGVFALRERFLGVPKLSQSSEDVRELVRVCDEAGLGELSPDTYRKALRSAMEQDPAYRQDLAFLDQLDGPR